jgi:hypothetical protein
MQAQRPYWFIQSQCDGRGKIISEDEPAVKHPMTVVYVKTVVKECDAGRCCCLCNALFDDEGRWNVYNCCNDALFYVCPDKECGDFMHNSVEHLYSGHAACG